MKHKRILVVSQHYYPESFRITDICEGLAADGFEIDVLCGLPNYPHGEWYSGYSYRGPRRESRAGVQIFRAGEIRRKGNTSVRIFFNYISYPVTALFNLWRLRKRHYDAVFCYETSPVLMLLPAIAASRLWRVPLTCYVLDLWPENLYSVLPIQSRLLKGIAKTVSHWHYRRCHQLIAMSEALANTLRGIAPNAAVTVIPQYCEDFYAAPIYSPQLSARFPQPFRILFAGNISPAQDLGLLVECAKMLKAAHNSAIHFIIVGDGMSRSALEQEIQQAGVQAWFTLEGQKPPTEIPAYTTLCDALFAALRKSDLLGQTVPAKITSYLAAGKPCLTCIDGEAARVIEQANCGLTAPAGNAKALYQNILTLAAMSNEQRNQMGSNAYQYYAQHFSRSLLLNRLKALF